MPLLYSGSLHTHTEYSNEKFRDSINKLKATALYCNKLGHKFFAITDHDTTSGWIKGEEICDEIRKENPEFKFIRGNEIYLCRNGLSAETYVKGDNFYHFILLAKDIIGARQIFQLSTRAWMRSYKQGRIPRVPTYYSDIQEIIGSNPGHVIAASACLGGFLGKQLMNYGSMSDGAEAARLYETIKSWILTIQGIFGKDNFYLELQPSATPEQTFVNRELITLSNLLKVPYIITNDAHYLSKDKRPIHKAYLNSQDGDREVDAFYATTYLMDTEELESYLDLSREELDKAYEAIDRIYKVCENYSLKKLLRIPELKWRSPTELPTLVKDKWFKCIPELLTFYLGDYEGDRILANLIMERFERDKTLHNQETYDETNENLRMTRISSEKNNVHWSAYFLNLQGIIDTCWEAGSIVAPGRGSGVGFLLLYILDITQINPLRETTRTFAWRFLNPDRVSVLNISGT